MSVVNGVLTLLLLHIESDNSLLRIFALPQLLLQILLLLHGPPHRCHHLSLMVPLILLVPMCPLMPLLLSVTLLLRSPPLHLQPPNVVNENRWWRVRINIGNVQTPEHTVCAVRNEQLKALRLLMVQNGYRSEIGTLTVILSFDQRSSLSSVSETKLRSTIKSMTAGQLVPLNGIKWPLIDGSHLFLAWTRRAEYDDALAATLAQLEATM